MYKMYSDVYTSNTDDLSADNSNDENWIPKVSRGTRPRSHGRRSPVSIKSSGSSSSSASSAHDSSNNGGYFSSGGNGGYGCKFDFRTAFAVWVADFCTASTKAERAIQNYGHTFGVKNAIGDLTVDMNDVVDLPYCVVGGKLMLSDVYCREAETKGEKPTGRPHDFPTIRVIKNESLIFGGDLISDSTFDNEEEFSLSTDAVLSTLTKNQLITALYITDALMMQLNGTYQRATGLIEEKKSLIPGPFARTIFNARGSEGLKYANDSISALIASHAVHGHFGTLAHFPHPVDNWNTYMLTPVGKMFRISDAQVIDDDSMYLRRGETL